MAYRLVNTFEGGADGAVLLGVADYGFKSGLPWDITQGGSQLTYDASTFSQGSKSLKIDFSVNSNGCVGWGAASLGSSGKTAYARLYFKVEVLPVATTTRFVVFGDLNGTNLIGQVVILASGLMALQDMNQVTLATSATSVVTNEWCRLDVRIVSNGATGEIEARLFAGANANGYIPDETLTAGGANTNGADIKWFAVGSVNFSTGLKMWIDAVELNDSRYPGAFESPVPMQYETLFAGSETPYMTPITTVNADTETYTMGMVFSASVSGFVHGVAWCNTKTTTSSAAGKVPEIALYPGPSGGSGLIASKVISIVEISGGWNYQLFDTPVPVTAGTFYTAALLRRTYPYHANYFNVGAGGEGIRTRGHLTAPGSESTGNNFFTNTQTLAKPTTAFNSTWYGIDVLFSESETPEREYWGIINE